MITKRWILAVALVGGLGVPALAGAGQDVLLAQYETQAKAADGGFSGFSVKRGEALYMSTHSEGGADTPSCSSCHTKLPMKAGLTRAGKAIEPMAVSVSPKRFTDMEKTEKWFARNCKSVLGRQCSPQEKGDFITYLTGL